MATQNVYQGDGTANQVFNLTFEYLDDSDIRVEIKDTTSDAAATNITKDATNGWELLTPTSIRLRGNLEPASTENIRIFRETNISSKAVTFAAGSAIRAQDLNKANDQTLLSVEEWRDQRVPLYNAEMPDDLSMGDHQITNLGAANSDDDAVNRGQLAKVITDDLIAGDSITLTDAVGGTNSGDQTTVSVTDLGITRAKIANDAINGDKIADDVIDSEHYVAGSIDNEHLAASSVSSTNIIDGTIVNADINANAAIDGSKIAAGTIDFDRIKDFDIIVESEQDAASPAVADTNILSAKASSKRHDVAIQTSNTDPTAPSSGGFQPGKFQYQNVSGSEAFKIWTGSSWKTIATGVAYVPATSTVVRYVDNVNGDDANNNTGFTPNQPLKTIEKALELVNASSSGDGTVIHVASGVYKENLPLRIKKNNVSVIGASMRSVFVLPKDETEALKDMWEVDSGSYISQMTMLGLKVPTNSQSSRNNSLDNDSTYGLPSNQTWAVRFRTDTQPTIIKSPYIQNCTHFSDAHLDIANFNPNTFASDDSQTYSSVAGDQTSAPCGGGLLVDGDAVSSTSPIRSMVVDAFTQITLDGPGILVTNNGYAQLVSFFGTFCHYHAKARNGGQINLSNCVTDFGRYGLIADGHGDTFATATASAANSGATTVTIGAMSTTTGHHVTATRPLDHMMVTIDGNDYGVVSSAANGSGWNVTITPALTQNISNTTVNFSLRSYISTGGHTFEYVGVGTDYSDHPDKGGVPVEANQTVQLNNGKVWQSSTDQIGKFQVGDVMTVDQVAEKLTVAGDLVVNQGQTVNGNISVTGTVDGRDLSTDGTKLDNIEDNATADQTAAEIRSLVDSASDSNVFTDADHTKLDGIAAGAEVNVQSDWNATSGDALILNKPSIPSAYGDSNVDSHLNRSSANSNEVLSWNGSDYDWVAQTTGYGDSNVDSHLNRSSAGSNEVLSWNGSDYDWVAQSSGGISDTSNHSTSLGLGSNALDSETGTGKNVALGVDAGTTVSSATSQVFVGWEAGKNHNGHGSTIVGAGAGNRSDRITCFGAYAGSNQHSGAGNVYLGYAAAKGSSYSTNNTGVSNVVIGDEASELAGQSFSENVIIGREAGKNNSSAHENVFIGFESGKDGTSCDENVAIGWKALENITTGSGNVVIGHNSGQILTTGSNNILIGHDVNHSGSSQSNTIFLGTSSHTDLRIPGLYSGASNGDVLTYNSSTSNLELSTPSSGSTDSITEGNTTVECVDTGSNGHITFDTEGTERMRIDSSGNVGIGTSSPSSYHYTNLVVAGGSSGNNNGMTLVANSNGDASIIAFADGTSSYTDKASGVIMYHHSDNTMRFFTAGDNKRLTINNNGALGVSSTGENYGSNGQVLRSNGSGSACTWHTLEGVGKFASNTSATATAIDFSTQYHFEKTVTADTTYTFTTTNVSGDYNYVFTVTIWHTNGTITWPTSVKWPNNIAPTLTPGTNTIHNFIFQTNDGGTTVRGAVLKNYAT